MQASLGISGSCHISSRYSHVRSRHCKASINSTGSTGSGSSSNSGHGCCRSSSLVHLRQRLFAGEKAGLLATKSAAQRVRTLTSSWRAVRAADSSGSVGKEEKGSASRGRIDRLKNASYFPSGYEWMERENADVTVGAAVTVVAALVSVIVLRKWLITELLAAVKLVLLIFSSSLLFAGTAIAMPIYYLAKQYLPPPVLSVLATTLTPLANLLDSVDPSAVALPLLLTWALLFVAQFSVLNPKPVAILLWPAALSGVAFALGVLPALPFWAIVVSLLGVAFLTNKGDWMGVVTPAAMLVVGFVGEPSFCRILCLGVYVLASFILRIQGMIDFEGNGAQKDLPVYDQTRLGVHGLLWLAAVFLSTAVLRQRFFAGL